jgi:hypothetical protein
MLKEEIKETFANNGHRKQSRKQAY